MKKCLTLFRPQMRVLITENELNGVEEVGLARPVPTNDDVVPWVEGLDDRLLPVGLEALDDHLLDVHLALAGPRGHPVYKRALNRVFCNGKLLFLFF